MKNRVAVSIAGREYTFTASEDESYVRRVAAFVDQKLAEVSQAARISPLDCAVLACANIADEYFKLQSASENLRQQLKAYLEESSCMKAEISELKRAANRQGRP